MPGWNPGPVPSQLGTLESVLIYLVPVFICLMGILILPKSQPCCEN